MQDSYDYQTALKTLRKLLAGARNASEQGKYAALERIIQGAEKISDHLLTAQDRLEITEAMTVKQTLNRDLVDSFKSAAQQRDYIKVVGEIIS